MAKKHKKSSLLTVLAYKIPAWVGTPVSIVLHTIFFGGTLAIAPFIGFDRTINVLTNIVSLEAIYLTIFVQMSIMRQHKKLRDIGDDIDDILEDTADLTKEEKEEIKEEIKTKIKEKTKTI